MAKKQLATLFICSLVTWVIFQALITLLPVYAVRLGADPALIGNYLAFSFAALTAGTVISGWLSNKFQRRKAVLMAAAVLNIPATWLLAQTTTFWQLTALTALILFLAGIGLGTITILAGLFAGESERGKIFGILAINLSLGALIAGVISGPIVERWSYATLFMGAALCWVIQLFAALFLRDKAFVAPKPEVKAIAGTKATLGGAFYLLLFATFIAFACGFIATLGRPLQMDQLGFSPGAISGVVAIGGAISLPFPLLLGWLSDRIDRYRLVALCFLIGAVGLIAMAMSSSLWHFGIATILLSGVGVSIGISQALVIDLVPGEALAVALSRYGSAPTIGAVIGFPLIGYAIKAFGMNPTLIAGAVLTLIAIPLLFRVKYVEGRRLAEA
ncbi:MAG: MFS transporter [Chloroflexota bacterium]